MLLAGCFYVVYIYLLAISICVFVLRGITFCIVSVIVLAYGKC